MDKKFGLILGACVVGLVIIIIVLNLFTSSKSKEETSTPPLPTQAPVTRTGSNFNQPKVSASMQKTLQQEQSRLLQLKPLTTQQHEAMQKLKDSVQSKPVDNDDFAIIYSEDLNQFYIQLKSSEASQKLEEYLALDPELPNIYKNDTYDYFKTGTISPQTAMTQAQQAVDDYREKEYQARQTDSDLTKVDTPSAHTPSPTAIPNENDPTSQIKPAMNVFKSLMGFNLALLPPTVPSLSPTAADKPASSDQSVPSNLDSLFAEAGQRVGTPAQIIKGVMAHECGVLLSETVANIQAWSKSGAGLPITHKCFDGGYKKGDGLDLGPMQFYIPRYFEIYSQSVNQFGGYNRSNPYVENIVDSVYASAYKLKLDSKSTDANFSCLEVKRASWCYACGCTDYNKGDLGTHRCRFAPGLFQYLWGYYKEGKPMTSAPAC